MQVNGRCVALFSARPIELAPTACRTSPSDSLYQLHRRGTPMPTTSEPISIAVSKGVAISARSTSITTDDHVAVFNLASQGGLKVLSQIDRDGWSAALASDPLATQRSRMSV